MEKGIKLANEIKDMDERRRSDSWMDECGKR